MAAGGAGSRPGQDWARILSTVLFGLAALELTGIHGLAQLFRATLTWLAGWLAGMAMVWLLRRPASSAFFTRCRRCPGNSELNDLQRASAALTVSHDRAVPFP